jgi:N-glycosylase/DNA lyase
MKEDKYIGKYWILGKWVVEVPASVINNPNAYCYTKKGQAYWKESDKYFKKRKVKSEKDSK